MDNTLSQPQTPSHQEPTAGAAKLGFEELRHQLDALADVSDTLRAHLAAERDAAARRGDSLAARALERGLLQVTRVRNDVRCACHELDAAHVAADTHLAAA